MDNQVLNRQMVLYRTPNGFYRMLPLQHRDAFVYRVLVAQCNRSILHRIFEYTYCVFMGHAKSVIMVRGYHSDVGDYEIYMCEWCRREVLETYRERVR